MKIAYYLCFIFVSFGFDIISIITTDATHTFIYCIAFLRACRRNHRVFRVIMVNYKFVSRRTFCIVGNYESVFTLLLYPRSVHITFSVQRHSTVTRRQNHANYMTILRPDKSEFGSIDTHIHIILLLKPSTE